MSLQPQFPGRGGRIDGGFLPPFGFVAKTMNFPMMAPAQGNRELIADLASERAALREAKMMSVGRLPAADQTGTARNKFDMVAITEPARLGQCQNALVDLAPCAAL